MSFYYHFITFFVDALSITYIIVIARNNLGCEYRKINDNLINGTYFYKYIFYRYFFRHRFFGYTLKKHH